MRAPFEFDRAWSFPRGVDELWSTLARTECYPRWWSWLDSFESDGLAEGSVARVAIRSPLPYSLRLRIEVVRLVSSQRVETTVSGDLAGPARLELEAGDDGSRSSRARLVWSLVPRAPALRHLGRWGRPVLVWAHDRVVERGVEQFRRRALAP